MEGGSCGIGAATVPSLWKPISAEALLLTSRTFHETSEGSQRSSSIGLGRTADIGEPV